MGCNLTGQAGASIAGTFRRSNIRRSTPIGVERLVYCTPSSNAHAANVSFRPSAEAFELSRAMNAGCGFLCSIHANSATDALDALVNAALMAGENVTERVVTKVFSEALDLVVHVDRNDARRSDGTAIGREVSEIVAVSPSFGESFTCEPIFTRRAPGAQLEWTGVLPEPLAQQCDRLLAPHRSLRDILDQRIDVTS